MNAIWSIKNFKIIPLIKQICYKNGLKDGERPTTKEFMECYKRHPDWLELLGNTELNAQELANEYVSHGKKTLIIKRKEEN